MFFQTGTRVVRSDSCKGQRRNKVRWRPGQEASLALSCSNLRSFGSKFTTLKNVHVAFLGLFGATGSHLAPPQWFGVPIVFGARRIMTALPPPSLRPRYGASLSWKRAKRKRWGQQVLFGTNFWNLAPKGPTWHPYFGAPHSQPGKRNTAHCDDIARHQWAKRGKRKARSNDIAVTTRPKRTYRELLLKTGKYSSWNPLDLSKEP